MTRLLLGLAGIALGLLLGWLVIRELDWELVVDQLRGFPPLLFLAGLIVILASTGLRALRWRLLYHDPRVRTHRLFLIENAAIGLNNVSPVRILSEPTQIGLLTLRDRLAAGEVVATLGITRTLDLLVTITALALVLFLIPALQPFYPLIGIAAVASGAGIAALFILALSSARVPLVRRLPIASQVKTTFRELRRRPGRVLLSLAGTCGQWALVGLCAWVISQGTAHPIAYHQALAVILGAIFFATSVPGLPAALGTFEFAAVYLLGFLAVQAETAITFALLMHVLLFVPQMVFAVIVLPREGVGSVQAVRELTARWG